MPVSSQHLGIHGICDVVEIQGDTAVPIEYKLGGYRVDSSAHVQLVGQVLCLQESGLTVEEAYIYSVAERRRHLVELTPELIDQTLHIIDQVHAAFNEVELPASVNDKRCRRCSLKDDCLPEITHKIHISTNELFKPSPEGRWRD